MLAQACAEAVDRQCAVTHCTREFRSAQSEVMQGLVEQVAHGAAAMQWTTASTEAAAIAFRMLAVRPWGQQPAHGHALLESLGQTFTLCDVRNDLLRPIADIWGRWAMRHVRQGGRRWWALVRGMDA